jgi:hypothetical protein
LGHVPAEQFGGHGDQRRVHLGGAALGEEAQMLHGRKRGEIVGGGLQVVERQASEVGRR